MDVPYSTEYDDIYYSREGGYAESRYVFLNGNHLPSRWETFLQPHFTILELGFGTGLNFLTTWKLWKEFQEKHPGHPLKRLFFLSCEKSPLEKETIQYYLKAFPELEGILESFLEKYHLPVPNPPPGYYRYHFPKEGIILQLFIGEALPNLVELEASVDAFYLDGFNPAKNPELWTLELFQELYRVANKDATLATYSSATAVRERLTKAGFVCTKTKGFGKKREMTQAIVDPTRKSQALRSSNPSSWSPYFVLGAGIAGASVCYALSLREVKPILYDDLGIAQGASGNPVGIFYPYLTKYPLPFSRFSLQAFFYGLDYIFLQNGSDKIINSQGLDLLLPSQEMEERYLSALKEFQLPTHVAEFRENPKRIFFPKGLAISPRDFVKSLLHLSSAEWVPRKGELSLKDQGTLIFCNSYQVNSLPSFQKIPVRKTRGQIAIFSQEILANPPEHPICSQSYLTPWKDGLYVAGSTYDEFQTERGYSTEDEIKIFTDLKKITPIQEEKFPQWIQERQASILETIHHNPWEGNFFRVAHRAQTRDRVPIVGKIPEGWVLTGLGSRGLVTAMLAGEMLVSELFQEPSPVPKSVKLSLSPERFLKKGSNSLQ